MSRLRNIAVVLAAGAGRRIGGPTPKQLLPVGGRRVVEHSLAAFHVDEVDEIVLVAPPGESAQYDDALDRSEFPKVSRTIDGGADRTESTRRALAVLGEEECNVLIHDAARPLVGHDTVLACIAALDTSEAVGVAVPPDDTVVAVDGDVIVEVLDRGRLRLMQTPQGFRLSVLRAAYERAGADPAFSATDNCSVVQQYLPDVPVRVVPGSRRNVKITHPDDLVVAEALLGTPL